MTKSKFLWMKKIEEQKISAIIQNRNKIAKAKIYNDLREIKQKN